MGLAEIAFPYRTSRGFGVSSFALLFVALVIEIELVVLLALALVERRVDLFIALQAEIFPAVVLVSLAAAVTFALRARSWTRDRIRSLGDWTAGASGYAEHVARSRRG